MTITSPLQNGNGMKNNKEGLTCFLHKQLMSCLLGSFQWCFPRGVRDGQIAVVIGSAVEAFTLACYGRTVGHGVAVL